MKPRHRIVRSLSAIAILASACAFLFARGEAASTGPLNVTATQISSFDTLGIGSSFGPFEWRGGLTLEGSTAEFGGLSGLALSHDCEDLVSVSDQGNWFTAKLSYKDGKLDNLSDPAMAPIRDSKGRPLLDKIWADAEAVAPLNGGRLGIAFERKVRFGAYEFGGKKTAASFVAIPSPKEIERGPENGEVEAFGQLPSGAFIAIAEKQRDAAGDIRAWMWKGKSTAAFSIARYDSYNITDLAVLPDGQILTMERRFNRSSLPGMAIRRIDPKQIGPGKTVKPELLLEAGVPFYAIDNMEGIAVCERDGETRVTLQSDDNFNHGIQSTILLQFALKPQ